MPHQDGDSLRTAETPIVARPADADLDYFGISHRGLKRTKNDDHFLLATIHQAIELHGTSLPDAQSLPLRGQRLGTVLMVADGVGGSKDGEAAARVAVETIIQYVATSFRSYDAVRAARDDEITAALDEAAYRAHDAVRAESASRPDMPTLATTLTLGIGAYPWFYFLQLGDSRAYIYTHGSLRQVTRDQTVAQDLLEMGALKPQDLETTPLRHVLSSSIGGDQSKPVVTRVDISERGCIGLFCTDGLTKHVTDAEIEQHCAKTTSSERLARDLLQLALDRGGSDNITIVVGRAPLRSSKPN